ncbi:transposase [bacterium]|nr:transposase [bacterium]
MATQGKALTPEVKKVIVSVKLYFDWNELEKKVPLSSVQRTADAVKIGVATVKRIMADYNRDPDSLDRPPSDRGRKSYAIDSSYQEKVRTYVREANNDGSYITLNDIREFLLQNGADESFHISTLARTLDRWGFEFGKGVRSQHLKEKDHVVAARQRFLRKKRRNRAPDSETDTVYPEVYLDESYVNKNHSNDFTWYYGEDGPWVQKPTGNGERLIIMNAITRDGWVPNAKTVFKSTRKTGDYHGQMNAELFTKWFEEKLIPNIPDNSLIIMDNAPYHNILSPQSAPTAASSRKKIRDWLEKNNIACGEDCLKAEMVELLERIAPAPIYVIDEIAQKYGHEVIRTPPYHPELQPIETCWGVVKNYVARNCDFTMKNLANQLEQGFSQVTADTCEGIIKKVREKEDCFWEDDIKKDN